MQLIRLGDASNFSSHGRTSASTFDDAFSAGADAASSTGATSDGESYSEDENDDEPQLPGRSRLVLESSPMPPGTIRKTHKSLDEILPSIDSSEPSSDGIDGDYDTSHIKSEHDDYVDHFDGQPKAKKAKTSKNSVNQAIKGRIAKPGTAKTNKAEKGQSVNGKKSKSTSGKTNAAANGNGAPRKTSSTSSLNFQHQLAADEEDLSSKPRCQRCRKSKKGCDRQRPCQRCKDAGIGAEGCVSEDEGNGRKGRYGRHMGVPIKKGSNPDLSATSTIQAVATAPATFEPKQPFAMPAGGGILNGLVSAATAAAAPSMAVSASVIANSAPIATGGADKKRKR